MIPKRCTDDLVVKSRPVEDGFWRFLALDQAGPTSAGHSIEGLAIPRANSRMIRIGVSLVVRKPLSWSMRQINPAIGTTADGRLVGIAAAGESPFAI